jgi:hypothetical protein
MRWLLRLYPARWRQRYGEEFLALLESQSCSPSSVLDVLLGAVDAWLRPQLRPSRSPATASGGFFRRRDRFDRFTTRSRAALRLAQVEAESLQHRFIGTEHLLLGLLHDPDNVALHVLQTYGVQPATLRAAVEHQLGAVAPGDPPTRGLTERSKRAIELSVEEATRMRHSYVGTEHLLVGLLRENGGTAALVLRSVGCADLEELRRRVIDVLNDG